MSRGLGDVYKRQGLVKTLNNWSGAISMKMEKMRELNQKGVTFEWDTPHQEEFEKIKKHLMETTTIATWDKALPLRLYADAAKTGGLGYVLTQPDGDREHIIFCGSTGLTDAQRRWSMCELELGAICFALENAHNFTYGANDIEILTDHSPLVGLSKKCLDEIPNPRITSLFDKISHYNYRIKHIKGEQNVPADVLSRLPSHTKDLQDVSHFVPVHTITIAAVQTRSNSIRIARDLIDMASRAKEDEDYKS